MSRLRLRGKQNNILYINKAINGFTVNGFIFLLILPFNLKHCKIAYGIDHDGTG